MAEKDSAAQEAAAQDRARELQLAGMRAQAFLDSEFAKRDFSPIIERLQDVAFVQAAQGCGRPPLGDPGKLGADRAFWSGYSACIEDLATHLRRVLGDGEAARAMLEKIEAKKKKAPVEASR